MKLLSKIIRWFGILTAIIFIIFTAFGIYQVSTMTEAEKQAYQQQQDSIQHINDSIAAEKQAIEQANQRREEIKKQFSSWDSSHRTLTKFIKENLKDPKSYEHIETRFSDETTHLYVITKYRAKNSFGGYVVNQVKANITLKGEIIQITTD